MEFFVASQLGILVNDTKRKFKSKNSNNGSLDRLNVNKLILNGRDADLRSNYEGEIVS